MMGVRILFDDSGSGSQAALYCSTTDWSFGPVISGDDDHDAQERAESFCRWLGQHRRADPRSLSDSELSNAYGEWLAQEAAQWKAEEPVDEDVRPMFPDLPGGDNHPQQFGRKK
jgi:hypothetical protein